MKLRFTSFGVILHALEKIAYALFLGWVGKLGVTSLPLSHFVKLCFTASVVILLKIASQFFVFKFGFGFFQIKFEYPKPLAKPMRTYPQKRQL